MTSVVAGLSSIEASRRLAVDGPNQLPAPRRPSALRHFGKQFTHPLAILLWVASGLALLAGQPALAVAIVVVIVLGVSEAVCALTTFVAVLSSRGWTWGSTPPAITLAIASGSAFAAIALGQMANAFACRSETQPVWRQRVGTNRLLIAAVTAELVLLGVFLGFTPLARLLGGSWPSTLGWALAFCAVPIVIIVDASYKALRRSRSRELALASVRVTSGGRR